jgi:4-hydroxy-3-methylbut-2-enyl diphosphate reductase
MKVNIIRAKHLGLCFGVRDAIKLATAERENGPLTILGELAHNPRINAVLEEQGISIQPNLDRVQTQRVLGTAHGLSDRAMNQARDRGFQIKDGACPLVRFAHGSLRKLVAAGFHPVVIGKKGHVEVRGLTEDFPGADVVLSEEDVAQLQHRKKFGVISQTTQPLPRVQRLVSAIRARFPASEVRFIDTVCQPTKLRQTAAHELAASCSVVIVIGGRNSNNTRELAATCAESCARVHQVEDADQINSAWFQDGDVVGITAGTSTPDEVIDQVEKTIGALEHELAVC